MPDQRIFRFRRDESVSAVQHGRDMQATFDALREIGGMQCAGFVGLKSGAIEVRYLDRMEVAEPGGWIVISAMRGVFVCAEAAFRQTYEPALDSPEPCGGGGERYDFENYERSALATEIIDRLEEREAEARAALEAFKERRVGEGIDPVKFASEPAGLVPYTKKRAYRDAILLVADVDTQRFIFGATQPHPASLTEDDRERLHSIATEIEAGIEAGEVDPDFAARDVRFLRRLAGGREEVDRLVEAYERISSTPHHHQLVGEEGAIADLGAVRTELRRLARDAEAEERRRVSHGMNGAGPHSAMRAYDRAADLLDGLAQPDHQDKPGGDGDPR